MRRTHTCHRAAAAAASGGRCVALVTHPTPRTSSLLSTAYRPLHSHWSLRRHVNEALTTAVFVSAPLRGASALHCSRATVKSRSMAPDDPFGEKSSWEDPSDGLYSAWKDADLEGFVNATQSAEVRNAHFGPEWARFTTVGRLSVKKMKEDKPVQPHPEASSETTTDAAAAAAAPASARKQYPTAEEMHDAELKATRRLLERNYTSYEAFVEHELGAGEGFSEEGAAAAATTTAGTTGMMNGAELYAAASMEGAFSAVEGLDKHDRMAQRNIEREALDTMEAAEVEEVVPLPNFIHRSDTRTAAAPEASSSVRMVATTTTAAAAAAAASSFLAEDSGRDAPSPTAITRPDTAAPAAADIAAIPTAVVRQVLRALGDPHGDVRIPLTDPMHWGTEELIHYITVMEQRPADIADDAPRDSWTTMDETMTDAFRMAQATGDTLLNVVVPPRLFRVLRRWHVRRQDVVNRAWKLHQETLSSTPGDGTSATGEIAEETVAAAVAQGRSKLDEAVQTLDHILIQETILLCFPYAR